MPRRNCRTAKPGQVYAIEWPEWHVSCAVEGCEEHAVVAGLGEASTVAEAEQRAKSVAPGWVKRGGLFYCPKHGKA